MSRFHRKGMASTPYHSMAQTGTTTGALHTQALISSPHYHLYTAPTNASTWPPIQYRDKALLPSFRIIPPLGIIPISEFSILKQQQQQQQQQKREKKNK